MGGVRQWSWCVAVWMLAPATLADVAVSIKYREACDGPIKDAPMGTVAATLGDAGGSAKFDASFTVSDEGSAFKQWSCVKFWWVQVLKDADTEIKWKGKDYPRHGGHPIIDPPSGGWDYMHEGNDQAQPVRPEFQSFVDDKPWYFTEAGQFGIADGRSMGSYRKFYKMIDYPTYPRGKDAFLYFTTFLAMVADSMCIDQADCLKPGQVQLLAAIDWRPGKDLPDGPVRSTGPFTRAVTAEDVTMVGSAFTEAGFNGYTATKDGVVCCPTPATMVIIVLGGGLAARRRRQ